MSGIIIKKKRHEKRPMQIHRINLLFMLTGKYQELNLGESLAKLLIPK